MPGRKDEYGKVVFPHRTASFNKISQYLYVIAIFFNFTSGMLNIYLGKSIRAFIQIALCVIFGFIMFFAPTGRPVIYEKGIFLPTSRYKKFRGIPDFIPSGKVVAISPMYQWNNRILKIAAFKIFYTKEDYLLLRAFKLKKYIEILSSEHGDFWNERFNENYDLENIDWDEVKRTLEFSEGKLIGKGFLFGVPIGFVLMAILKIVFDIETSVQFYLTSGAIIIGVMQIGLFVIKIILMKKMGTTFTLIRYVTLMGEKYVPLEVTTSEKYSKIMKTYVIDYIQTYDNWRDPVKYKAVMKDVENRKRMLKKRFIFIGIVVGIVCIAMIFMCVFGYWILNSPDYDYNKNTIPQDGQYVIMNTTYIGNQTLEMRDNLVILGGGNLHLDNVTFIWNMPAHGDSGFFVEENGAVTARDCTFEGYSAESTYRCEIQGGAHFHNCTFSNLWGDEDDLIGQGGIEIYNDDVLIDGCVISNGKVSGIVIGDCNPTIRNSLITNNDDDGIEIFGASPIIENNTIRNNNDGIMIYHSDPIIRNNHILDNNGRGIGIMDDSDPELVDNTFSNNQEENIFRSDDSFLFCLILLPALFVLIIIPLMVFKYRSEMKKLQQ